MKTALITGITGQDGAYLAKFLLGKNYDVYGAYRRTSSVNFWRLQEVGVLSHPNMHLIEYDLTDLGSNIRTVDRVKPDEVYNLAAQSYVGVSFEQPCTATAITGMGALHVLEAIRTVNKGIKFYQASSSEMFGKVQAIPQSESTPFYPRSPYAVSKVYAHWMTINYREAYDIFGSCGILFNHESPLRGQEFVTRKITHAVAQIVQGKLDVLQLGNLDPKRDWGYAEEYVEGMWLMLQAKQPDSYILATGKTVTVRDFADMAFSVAGIDLAWSGSGVNEVAKDKKSGVVRVRVNPDYCRPAEVDLLLGDPSKARAILGWEAKTTLKTLCTKMLETDMARVKSGFSY